MGALKRPGDDEKERERVVTRLVKAYLEISNLNPRKLHGLIGLGLGAAPVIVALWFVNKFVLLVNPVLFGLMMVGGGAMGAIGVVTARKVERERLPEQARIRDIEEQYHARLEAIEAAMLPKKEATRRRGLALDEYVQALERERERLSVQPGADGREQASAETEAEGELAGASEQLRLPAPEQAEPPEPE